MNHGEIGDLVARCASLAALLEVSAYPKPGNIHRVHDYPDTRYEHFLAGSVAMMSTIRSLAEKGYELRSKGGNYQTLGLGEAVYKSVREMFSWQSGGNVHLGVILLFCPIAAAAGATVKDGEVDIHELRTVLRDMIQSATPEDTVEIYNAIGLAMSAENLGDADELDVTDESSLNKIIEEQKTPIDVFKLCASRDTICNEWVSGFSLVFMEGYPYLKQRINEKTDINNAIIDTFLFILSNHVDALVLRKQGIETAQKVSMKARQILEAGGSSTEDGEKMLWEFDKELQSENGAMNPGTTADLTAASIFLLLLEGWRL
ncbi:MAG: triphosphoribosyl-dephospho-CoA synthase [Candidatus Bathyarchaeota archaeon]|nr:triphosphoribosyl-dephospho-CoA synthase [Candidatus Bathyarchaeota archaeon]